MEHTTITVEQASDPGRTLRWYQYSLSTILWITLFFAMLIANVVMRNNLFQAHRKIESIKETGAQEVKPGCVTQVSSGPGWRFCGDLPKGNWRIAVYSWNGEFANPLDIQPPPNLAPLVAEPVPNHQRVHIDVLEAELPTDTTHNEKTVTAVYNFRVIHNRPGQFGTRSHSTKPVLVSTQSGCTSIPSYTFPTPGQRGIVLWYKGHDIGVEDHLLLQIEPIDEKSLPPQLRWGTSE